MLIVIAQARLRSDAHAAFRVAADAVIRATRTESGCIAYDAHYSVGDPDKVVFVERWKSRADFDQHMGAVHTQEFLAIVSGLVVGAPTIEPFEVVAG